MLQIERTKHDVYPFISHAASLKDCAQGKVVLITGGSKGIGKAIASHFALAGADIIIICGRRPSLLEEATSQIQGLAPSCMVVAYTVDVTDETSVQGFFKELPCVPHVLVNNVGAAQSQKSIVESDVGDWWSDYELNVRGVYLCSRAYLRLLRGRPGVILNVSSSVSTFVNEGLSSYASAKTAVNRQVAFLEWGPITEFIHAEHHARGVICIAFHPGGIADTGMGENVPENLRQNLIDSVDLAAGTALYLSTPRAAFLSGRFVFGNWDMEKVEAIKDEIVGDDLLKTRIILGGTLKSATVLN
ncbi:hypothetical protein MMC30_003461 [Trapelia coarctata]|nr:hypothetical protein [Trapelia coarctata]